MPGADNGVGVEAPRLGGHIFISYASEDRDLVLKLRDQLIDRGATSVWIDKPEIDPGDKWQKKIRDGLRRTQITLAVITGWWSEVQALTA